MKKYVLTSQNLTGSVIFGYDDAGLLVFYDATPAMITEKQLLAVLKNLPREAQDLQALADKTKCTLELLPEDLSFEVFWNKYDKKINRKRCEPLYKKLDDTEKTACIRNIKPYEDYLYRTNFRGKADPDNYIKKEYYAVDWKRER
ncbi:hypothetical protein H7F33_05585 [Pedobacter sp. PAMC26386]|nr:hypothetical protein H7F33_05585 [Pedobacter sp. PAMC26386]